MSLFALDVDNDPNIASLARQLDSVPIDGLINNAGISKPEASTLGQISSEVWLQVFRTNTIAPLKMAEAFLPNLEAGKEKKLIAISSRLGSIELNDGGRYSYRSSKAALNSVWKSLAGDTAGKGMICRDLEQTLARGGDAYLFRVVTTAVDYTCHVGDSIIVVRSDNVTITLPRADQTKEKRFTVKNGSAIGEGSPPNTTTVQAASGNIDVCNVLDVCCAGGC